MGFYDITFVDCYQLTINQTFKAQLVINRYFYQCNGPYTDELTELAENLSDALLDVLEPIQHYDCVYDFATILELFGDRQSVQFPFTARNGSATGVSLPAFFGARWRLHCTDSRIRKGRKIYAGIPEESVDGNNLASGMSDEYAAVSAKLQEVLVLGDFSFTPVLLSPANTRHTGNLIVPVYYAAWAGWSTQGSRKIGRGA